MISDTIRQDNSIVSILNKILQMDLLRTSLLLTRIVWATNSNKREYEFRMLLAAYANLICWDTVSLFSFILHIEAQNFITHEQTISELACFLSSNEDIEVLSFMNNSWVATSLSDDFLVKLPKLSNFTMVVLFGVENRGNFYGFGWTWIPELDEERSINKSLMSNLSIIGEYSRSIRAFIVVI